MLEHLENLPDSSLYHWTTVLQLVCRFDGSLNGRPQEFSGLGTPTADASIRQITIQFRTYGYIARYIAYADTGDILVTRIWHGREARE